MLTLPAANAVRFCGGLSRRNFLQLGTLGLGGLTLAELLRLKAHGAVKPRTGSKAAFTTASRGFRMVGSGTVCTRTSFFPSQQIARIGTPLNDG